MNAAAQRGLRFTKMHGAGNDFVILDLRAARGYASGAGAGVAAGAQPPDTATSRLLADRHRGIGCDQLIAILDPVVAGSVAAYRIWNTDGSPAEQCGNGARCVAAWLHRDRATTANAFALDSPAGTIEVRMHAADDVELAMTVPEFAPARIPLAMADESPEYEIDVGGQAVRFGAASMGNPHALIEVAEIAVAPVARLGSALQASEAFPESVNVGFAQVLSADRIALRIYERGVGETLACGSGACAAVAILARQGRVDRDVAVELPGGTLRIAWPRDDAPVRMRGPAAFVFEGEWIP
ncbi:MAG TPA: diaminopimelate epimerase [Xanthomonadaceae bacterium]|jgi:diaminopimelate epimerase|nr:diaminopimelate epimerase [Xanthomonadaceae bacterium]